MLCVFCFGSFLFDQFGNLWCVKCCCVGGGLVWCGEVGGGGGKLWIQVDGMHKLECMVCGVGDVSFEKLERCG